MLFELEEPITDPDKMRFALIGLGRKFRGDPKIQDASRLFFGSRRSKPLVFGNILPQSQLDDLIEFGKIEKKKSDTKNKQQASSQRSRLLLDDRHQAKDIDGIGLDIKTLPTLTPVCCPYHEDKHPSAFVVRSRQESVGIHCAVCQQTFWSTTPTDKYNFYRFDEIVRSEARKNSNLEYDDDTDQAEWRVLFDLDKDPWHIIVNEKFLPKVPVSEGVTLFKSPKGSGKTELLKTQIKNFKKKKLRILLVGHRQLLLHEIANRLGLTCYLDGNKPINKATKHYAISIDSLANRELINPFLHKYDVVIIDESEQVFSHFVSDTLRERRRLAYLALEFYLTKASYIIALDADLNEITATALAAMVHDSPNIRFVLNEYHNENRILDLYKNKRHLEADLFDAIARKERCFVASNSKSLVDKLYEVIQKEHNGSVKAIRFTQDNSSEEETINILHNLTSRIEDYDVILASPTLGTGVDISFQNGRQLIDGVYGFFEARINTHFDIDQQLSRVRNPKYIKVWITPETFNFETEESVILNELIRNEALPELMEGYDDSGQVKIDDKNPFLNLYATVISAQRASKNNLKHHFIELRKRNGWTINPVEKDDDKAEKGGDIEDVGNDIVLEKYITALLSARMLTDKEFKERVKLKRSSKHLSLRDRYELVRSEIERFYDIEITLDLIRNDDKGRFRQQIVRFERLFDELININQTNDSAKPSQGSEYATRRMALRKKLLVAAGVLDQDGSPDFSRIITANSLDDFIDVCIEEKPAIERMLDMPVRKDIRTKPTSQLRDLLNSVGMNWTRKIKKIDGKKVYQYSLNQSRWNQLVELSRNRKLKRLWTPTDDEEDAAPQEDKDK